MVQEQATSTFTGTDVASPRLAPLTYLLESYALTFASTPVGLLLIFVKLTDTSALPYQRLVSISLSRSAKSNVQNKAGPKSHARRQKIRFPIDSVFE